MNDTALVSLNAIDLAIAALLVLSLAVVCSKLRLSISKQLLVAAVRTTAQLLLVGLVLKTLFAHAEFHWMMIMALVMISVAGWEIIARQKRKLKKRWAMAVGTLSLFVSSFIITVLALMLIIQADPWYSPQYAIPLLGMLLGNTMNGIALGLDRLVQSAWQQRMVIEQRLMLGQSYIEAMREILKDSMRAGMIPIINAMATAGVVSLPGMMTGQILAGSPPVEAVKYQILIMFLIAGGTGFGVIVSLRLVSARLFDDRERLNFSRLLKPV